MITAPQNIIQAWTEFHKQLNAPQSEAEYLELKAFADYLIDHHKVSHEPYASLFDLVTGFMHAWELENEPELKDTPVPAHLMLAHYLEQGSIREEQLYAEGLLDEATLQAILNGETPISRTLAEELSRRIGVNSDVFY